MHPGPKGEEDPRTHNRGHSLVFPGLEGGLGLNPWIEKTICASDEGINVSPAHRPHQTGILVGRCFATRTDRDFRSGRDPARYLRLGRQTCPSCVY